MPFRTMRVYADTSVYGGIVDDEFMDASRSFFAQVKLGFFQLCVSAVVSEELAQAPESVQSFFEDMLVLSEVIEVTPEAQLLQQAYLDAGILTPRWSDDALHIALATVSGCKLIVSWNFRHIVHFEKIPMYNAVNVLHGYDPIKIHSPMEVQIDEGENV